ncbi:MAG: hypothetical protein QXZ31_03770 [Thermofilaceae archaeon]
MFAKRREEGDEEKFPSSPGVTAIAVSPDNLVRLISEYFSSKPAEESGSDVPEIARDVLEAIRRIRAIVMSNQLRYIPQVVLSISSKRSFVESSKQMAMATCSVLDAVGEGYTSNIYKALDILSSSAPRDDKREAARIAYESMMALIGALYALPVVLKDLTGASELSLPFHLSSDLVKKLIGYTATT